jgi:hypothetical protein
MSNHVYANNEEVSCKAGMGKSICAFPDVCFTPPENPATPPGVPVPYPNTGMDGDTTDGSRTVQINGKEAMLKNKSYFKKSIGDEAGCAAKKGVVSSVNRGKVYFIAWSMDVKFEGENVVRNLDLTTHNHASPVTNTPPQIFAARMAMADIPGCEGQRKEVQKACGDNGEKFTCPDDKPAKTAKAERSEAKKAAQAKAEQVAAAAGKKAAKNAFEKDPDYQAANKKVDDAFEKMAQDHDDDDCRKRMRCLLSPYSPDKCCEGQTPHHLVEASSFTEEGREQGLEKNATIYRTVITRSLEFDTKISRESVGKGEVVRTPMHGTEKYDPAKAPCICVEGESQTQASHGWIHTHQNQLCRDELEKQARREVPKVSQPMNPGVEECRTLRNAEECGAQAVVLTFPGSVCDKDCIVAQLKKYHEQDCDMAPLLPIRAVEA